MWDRKVLSLINAVNFIDVVDHSVMGNTWVKRDRH